MSYLVLARKYRPQRFEDIVAQEHVTRTLQNAVRNDRIASGYLFCGPRGTGKTTTARVLAKALNCVKGPTPDPCGECSACKEIAAGTSLDVLEIDAASNTGVDDVRTLRENVRYLPTSGKKRIYIIDEVHRLSGAAFDALLKTLEEPPSHVVFMFATTEPLKVPETILSRTQRFDLKRVPTAALVSHLSSIAGRESLDVEEPVLKLLARKADGSVRDSLSLLDQVAAFAGQKITEADVVAALSLVAREALFEFAGGIATHDSKAVLKLVKEVVDAGVDIGDFVAELLEHLRILLILATDKASGDLIDITPEDLAEYTRQAEDFSVGDLLRLMQIGAGINSDLRSGLDERLVLEVAAVKMAEMEATVRFEDVLERLRQIPPGEVGAASNLFGQVEKKNHNRAPTAASMESAVGNDASSHDSPRSLTFSPRAVNAATVRAGWPRLLNLLKQKSAMLASNLAMAEIRNVEENRILAVFGASGTVARQVVEKPGSLEMITGCLREHFGTNLGIRFDIDPHKETEAPEPGARSSARVDVTKIADDSPRIRMLLEKVDGEIIGVKKKK